MFCCVLLKVLFMSVHRHLQMTSFGFVVAFSIYVIWLWSSLSSNGCSVLQIIICFCCLCLLYCHACRSQSVWMIVTSPDCPAMFVTILPLLIWKRNSQPTLPFPPNHTHFMNTGVRTISAVKGAKAASLNRTNATQDTVSITEHVVIPSNETNADACE